MPSRIRYGIQRDVLNKRKKPRTRSGNTARRRRRYDADKTKYRTKQRQSAMQSQQKHEQSMAAARRRAQLAQQARGQFGEYVTAAAKAGQSLSPQQISAARDVFMSGVGQQQNPGDSDLSAGQQDYLRRRRAGQEFVKGQWITPPSQQQQKRNIAIARNQQPIRTGFARMPAINYGEQGVKILQKYGLDSLPAGEDMPHTPEEAQARLEIKAMLGQQVNQHMGDLARQEKEGLMEQRRRAQKVAAEQDTGAVIPANARLQSENVAFADQNALLQRTRELGDQAMALQPDINIADSGELTSGQAAQIRSTMSRVPIVGSAEFDPDDPDTPPPVRAAYDALYDMPAGRRAMYQVAAQDDPQGPWDETAQAIAKQNPEQFAAYRRNRGMIDEYARQVPVTMTAGQIGDVSGNMVGAGLDAASANRARALAKARNDASRLSYRGATAGQVRDTLAAQYTPEIADQILQEATSRDRLPVPDVESVAPETAGAGLPGISDRSRDVQARIAEQQAALNERALSQPTEAELARVAEMSDAAIRSVRWPEIPWAQPKTAAANIQQALGDIIGVLQDAPPGQRQKIAQAIKNSEQFRRVEEQARDFADWGRVEDGYRHFMSPEDGEVLQGRLQNIVDWVLKAAQTAPAQ